MVSQIWILFKTQIAALLAGEEEGEEEGDGDRVLVLMRRPPAVDLLKLLCWRCGA